MTTKTERRNIDKFQANLGSMKKIAKEEQQANIDAGHAEHANAWTEVHARVELLHAELTKLGLEVFPEFFGEVVTRGGGGGR